MARRAPLRWIAIAVVVLAVCLLGQENFVAAEEAAATSSAATSVENDGKVEVRELKEGTAATSPAATEAATTQQETATTPPAAAAEVSTQETATADSATEISTPSAAVQTAASVEEEASTQSQAPTDASTSVSNILQKGDQAHPDIAADQFGNVGDTFRKIVRSANVGDVKKVEDFDFDLSSSYTFTVHPGERECFYEDITVDLGESELIAGAYIVSSAAQDIDVEVRDAAGDLMWVSDGKASSDFFRLDILTLGTYSICFSNERFHQPKTVTYGYQTLKENHPIQSKNLKPLEESLFRLEAKLGVVESEQQLYQLQMMGQIASLEATRSSAIRFSWLETIVYLCIVVGQALYFRNLLDPNNPIRSDAARGRKRWA